MCPSAAAPPKPICTICFEELKPIVEHLQCIPICGHAFHELCLQQWIEYCPAGRKPTCPVCKQSCSGHTRPTRLYFQSTGADTATQIAAFSSDSQKASSEPTAEALAVEVRRLELKLSSLTKNYETQQIHLKKLEDEASSWKELAEREGAKRAEIEKENECVEQFLRAKQEELKRKASECTKLEERSLGLAKELATLKLTTDLNLGEEEIMKFASLGHERNHENMICVLRRSLTLRNKSYKELMAQCNLLGRAETRSRQNLDKANEKIKKLKTRLLEAEKALEIKENDALRDLKASKKRKAEGFNFVQYVEDPPVEKSTKKIQANHKEPGFNSDDDLPNLNRTFGSGDICDEWTLRSCSSKKHLINLEDGGSFLDEDAFDHRSSFSEDVNRQSDLKHQPKMHNGENVHRISPCAQDDPSCPKKEAYSNFAQCNVTDGLLSPGLSLKNKRRKMDEDDYKIQKNSIWDEEVLVIDHIIKKTPAEEHDREAQHHDAAANPGDQYIPGVFGPNGASRNVGKWCGQGSSSFDMLASKASDDLITVGADGRGGRIKILRSHNPLMVNKAKASSSKKPKNHPIRSCQPSIEHFFGKPKV